MADRDVDGAAWPEVVCRLDKTILAAESEADYKRRDFFTFRYIMHMSSGPELAHPCPPCRINRRY
jgi:hypothetical protein